MTISTLKLIVTAAPSFIAELTMPMCVRGIVTTINEELAVAIKDGNATSVKLHAMFGGGIFDVVELGSLALPLSEETLDTLIQEKIDEVRRLITRNKRCASTEIILALESISPFVKKTRPITKPTQTKPKNEPVDSFRLYSTIASKPVEFPQLPTPTEVGSAYPAVELIASHFMEQIIHKLYTNQYTASFLIASRGVMCYEVAITSVVHISPSHLEEVLKTMNDRQLEKLWCIRGEVTDIGFLFRLTPSRN